MNTLYALGLLLCLGCCSAFWEEGDAPIEKQINETFNEAEDFFDSLMAQFDIEPPKYNVKKSGRIKGGKVLKAMTLSPVFKKAIILAHNRARSKASPRASNMRKMSWDPELERLATQYTRQCIYEHNPDPRHQRFDYVGENLFISMGLPYNKELLVHAVNAWDGEKTVYDYETRKCVPGKMCGHYTQVVWADSFKVGCGVTNCGNINVRGKIWRNAILFGCNYGPGGNYPTHPFVAGRPCSNCDERDKCRNRLCTNPMRDRLKVKISNAKWTPWTPWTPCSKPCGVGSSKRERKCSTYVQSDCDGFASEVKFCYEKPCNQSPMSGGSFQYKLVLREGDNLLKNSLQQALQGQMKMKGFRRTG